MIEKAIRIVCVEEEEKGHGGLIQTALHHAGIASELVSVQDRFSFMRQMQAALPQVVLLCYSASGLFNQETLQLHKQLSPQVPIIVLASEIGVDEAVTLMREGAWDVLSKPRHAELPAVVKRVLKEYKHRLAQQQAEESLQLSQRHLQNIFRMTPVGVFRCDPRKNCFFVNDRFCEITGLSPQEALGTGWLEALHPEDRPYIYQEWYEKKGVIEESKAIYRYQKPGTGETSWVIGQSISETDSEGRVVGYLGSITDITKLKEAEEALKEKNEFLTKVNKELDSFVYSASHNLRAPLTSLMGLINLIRLEPENPEARQRICDMMDHSLHRLDGFIRDILDHSRNARVAVQHQPVNAARLVEGVVEEFSLHEDFEKIDVQVMIQQDAPLYTDPDRLRIIFRNLISNCIRYHNRHQPPQIAITARVHATEATFQVIDNGIGIRTEHQPKVFDMFYRADEHRSGSGLGLYITREVVSKLGGSISLESFPAKGTTVRLVLPNQQQSTIEDNSEATGAGWITS